MHPRASRPDFKTICRLPGLEQPGARSCQCVQRARRRSRRAEVDLYGREMSSGVGIGTRIKAVNNRVVQFHAGQALYRGTRRASTNAMDPLRRYQIQRGGCANHNFGGTTALVANMPETIASLRHRRLALEASSADAEPRAARRLLSPTDHRLRQSRTFRHAGVAVGYNVAASQIDSEHNLIGDQQVHSKVSDNGLQDRRRQSRARKNLQAGDQIDARPVWGVHTRSGDIGAWSELAGSCPTFRSRYRRQLVRRGGHFPNVRLHGVRRSGVQTRMAGHSPANVLCGFYPKSAPRLGPSSTSRTSVIRPSPQLLAALQSLRSAPPVHEEDPPSHRAIRERGGCSSGCQNVWLRTTRSASGLHRRESVEHPFRSI